MYIALILMLATLLILIIGISLMASGGKLNKKYATKLMALRVIIQFLTIVTFGALYYLSR